MEVIDGDLVCFGVDDPVVRHSRLTVQLPLQIAVLGRGGGGQDFDRQVRRPERLDIFVISYGAVDQRFTMPGNHRLYRNNGDGTFTDIADRAGVATTSLKQPTGTGASFGDHDLDGDLDLAVASWFYGEGGNALFRNYPELLWAADYFTSSYLRNDGGGGFTDITEQVTADATRLRLAVSHLPRGSQLIGRRESAAPAARFQRPRLSRHPACRFRPRPG